MVNRIGNNGDENYIILKRSGKADKVNANQSKNIESIMIKLKEDLNGVAETKTEEIDIGTEMGLVRQEPDKKFVPLNKASVSNLPTVTDRRPMSLEEAQCYGEENHPDTLKNSDLYYNELDNSDGTKSLIFKHRDPFDGSIGYSRVDVKYNEDGSFVVGYCGGIANDLKDVFLDNYRPIAYYIYDKGGNLTSWLNKTTEHYLE